GDGGETVPAPGWWKGIYIYDGGSATLDNCVVRYGGHSHSWDSHNTRANILKVGAGDLTVTNSIISHNSNDGIRLENTTGTVTINDNDFIANQRDGISSDNSTPVISGNKVSNNSRYGLFVNGYNSPSNVSGNILSGNSVDIYLTVSGSGTLIGSNTFTGPIYVGNGTIAENISWGSDYPYYLTGWVTVGSDAVLTIPAGRVVKFAQGASLTVNGTLDA
ncbi:right-handed parallel beta-helix repeat-containing protein, partial [Dethiobacter alkaliphilus]|uniref:right-handed parallel beta-helix repeat-containing protein n=1 Tax=Dethiobacter alkaliphilus TaxID=427926 RepID=UPI002226EB2E